MLAYLSYGVFLVSLCLQTEGVLHNDRQVGKSNYQFDLEDVVVVALLDEDEGQPDYSYDYSDLTVKPEGSYTDKPTTSLPSSSSISSVESTSSPSVTPSTDTIVHIAENNSLIITHENKGNATLEAKPEKNSTLETLVKPSVNEQQPLNAQNYQIPVMIVTDTAGKLKKGYVSSSSIRRKASEPPVVDSQALPKRTCLQGFFLDDKNRCKKINRKTPFNTRNRPTLPYGLRFAQRPALLGSSEDIHS